MWLPDSFQVPRDVIIAELAKEVPTGTTLATVAFLLNQATTKEQATATVKSFGLDQSAAKIAWRFLNTNQLVTSDGEILSESGSQSSQTKNPMPSSTPISNVSSASKGVIAELWVKYYPNEPQLTTDQIAQVQAALDDKGQTQQWFENILINITHTGKAKNPMAVLFWKLKNESPDRAAQDAERAAKHPPPVDNVIRGAMERAKAEIAAIPAEEATDKTVARLSALKERMGGKSQ